ncbi:hypothetical protein [Bacillus thuringiensis]|nr:hypothetical protein [Bacillus thuringiensis]
MFKAQLKSKFFLLYVLEGKSKVIDFTIGSIVKFQKEYVYKNESFLGFIHDIYINPDYCSGGIGADLLYSMR